MAAQRVRALRLLFVRLGNAPPGTKELRLFGERELRAVRGGFKLMIAFRKSHASIGRPIFWREDVSWPWSQRVGESWVRVAVPCLLAPRCIGQR